MNLKLLTCCWGDKHIELFKRAALKSLGQPDNAKALVGAKWNIFTESKYFVELDELIKKEIPGVDVEFRGVETLRDRIDHTHSAVLWQIRECIEKDAKLLLVPPDTIFGDHSVTGLLKVGKGRHQCVVVPHPRVLPSILEERFFGTNPELVDIAFKHLHRSWSEAEKGHERQNSHVGGVAWERIQDHVYAVTHYLPTVYLAHFKQEDYDFFVKAPSFGSFDHEWPSALVANNRQLYVQSSEIAFMVEITEPFKNVPPIIPGTNPDVFWRNHLHNQHNSKIISVFRGTSL